MIAIHHFPAYLRARWNLRKYEPQRVTLVQLRIWVRQFPREHRSTLLRLAGNLRFVSRQETEKSLLELNRRVLKALAAEAVTVRSVIYVTTDTAGSSSGVMLNLLRNHANLERQGAHFVDSRDLRGIRTKTAKIRKGAIIYVDDFAATGNQFSRSREVVFNEIRGGFSEFFLLPCICEEAYSRIGDMGVEPRAGTIHKVGDRPFRDQCDYLSAERRGAMLALSHEYWSAKWAMGYGGLATNVVFYGNAPNTTPLIFRGHIGQSPLRGIVPRFDDLSAADR